MADADTRAALLRNVLANPDDDLVRLVLADALDETGDDADAARAEFIRLSVAGMRSKQNGDRFLVADEEATRFGLSAYLYSLAFEIPSPSPQDALFRRGFIDEVRCSAEHWLRIGDAITAAHPVRRVELTTRTPIAVTRTAGRRQWHCTLDVPGAAADAGLRRVTIVVSDRELQLYRGDLLNVAAERMLAAHWPRVRRWSLPQPQPQPAEYEVDRSVGSFAESLSHP